MQTSSLAAVDHLGLSGFPTSGEGHNLLVQHGTILGSLFPVLRILLHQLPCKGLRLLVRAISLISIPSSAFYSRDHTAHNGHRSAWPASARSCGRPHLPSLDELICHSCASTSFPEVCYEFLGACRYNPLIRNSQLVLPISNRPLLCRSCCGSRCSFPATSCFSGNRKFLNSFLVI